MRPLSLHIEGDEHTDALLHDWYKFVQESARKANRPVPELEQHHPNRTIAVLLPERTGKD